MEKKDKCILPVKIVFWSYLYVEVIFTRDSIYAVARICYRPSVCPSVCPSVTRVDQSKTVEVRIMKFSPYGSPIPLVFVG